MSTTLSIARALERIELIRSQLRWKSQLDQSGLKRTIQQLNQLRSDLLLLSRQEQISKGTKRHSPDVSVQLPPSDRKRALQDDNFSFTGIFGENPKLLTVLETLNKAAASDFPVLIEGESGTGKELMAKVVHSNSERASKPFVSINDR